MDEGCLEPSGLGLRKAPWARRAGPLVPVEDRPLPRPPCLDGTAHLVPGGPPYLPHFRGPVSLDSPLSSSCSRLRMITNSLNRDSPPGTPQAARHQHLQISVTVSNKMAARVPRLPVRGCGQGVGRAGGRCGLDGIWDVFLTLLCRPWGVHSVQTSGQVTASLGASPSRLSKGWRYPPPRTVGSP